MRRTSQQPIRSRATSRQVLVWIGWVALVAVVLGLILGSVFLLPGYLVGRDLEPGGQLPPAELVKAKNDVRSTLLQGIGGLVLVVGAIAAWRQLRLGREQLQASREQIQHTQEFSSRQLEISERGQITERFTRAIEQLASDNLYVRIGGVYGLELLAADSAVDKEIIAEVLLGLVHRRSPWPPLKGQLRANTPVEELPSLWRRAADVADAVRVIGRLPVPERMRPIFYLGSLDLRRAYLNKADLERAYLGNSNLARAELQGANLRSARLPSAILLYAELGGASLEKADLTNANLRGAKLDGAKFSEATANQYTRWPIGFEARAAGVIMEDSEGRPAKPHPGQHLTNLISIRGCRKQS
jgi:hypothetical protein